MPQLAQVHPRTDALRTACVIVGLIALGLLQACNSSAPTTKTPAPRDPKFWTPDGNLRASPKDEQAQWERIEKLVAESGGKPLPPGELLRYLRYSPDGPHAEAVRALLDTPAAPTTDAAVLAEPDAACRATVEKQYRGLFRLDASVPFPPDAFGASSTVVFPSRTGAPAPVEKRLIGELVADPILGSCTIIDRYETMGYGLPGCKCRALDPGAATRPRGKQASVLNDMGGLKAMRDACARNGVDVGKSVDEYRKALLVRAEGETGYEARQRAAGKPLKDNELYDARIWARVLDALRRDAHNPATYQSQSDALKTLTRKEAPEVCEGVRSMAAEMLVREVWDLKLRENAVKETWQRPKTP